MTAQIFNVIKRNGRKVKFQPEKLNKLASFASDTQDVSWSEIALNGLTKLHDMCTVQDITKALIHACIDKQTSAHLIVAGRLYVASMRKDIFPETGGKPLPLYDHIVKMQQLGYYQDFLSQYTVDDINTINGFLDHDSDFQLSYSQIHQMESKYFVRNRKLNRTYEIPQYMYARIAMAVYADKPNRLHHIKRYIELLNKRLINLPSPNLSNIGTFKKTSTSCTIYACEDTVQSIAAANHISELMTVAGAGLGLTYLIRSIGDPVKGGTIAHQGKLPYYRAAQGIVKSNKQGCYSVGTEVLTSEGWLDFSKVTNETMIAQVDETLEVSYAYPERVIAYHHKGDMYHFYTDKAQGVDILVTPDHRMLTVPYNVNELQTPIHIAETLAEDFKPSADKVFLTTATNMQDVDVSSNFDLLYLKLLISLSTRISSNKYEYLHDGKSEALAILQKNNIHYTVQYNEDLGGVVVTYETKHKAVPLTSLSINTIPGIHISKLIRTWIDLNHSTIKEFHETPRSLMFKTNDKVLVDFLQEACVLGFASSSYDSVSNTFTLYYPQDGGNTIPTQQVDITKVEYDDMVYCVEVPTNNIIVRKNNCVLVCGNSRGGALTVYTNVLDPEIREIVKARNPTTVLEYRIDQIDYGTVTNSYFDHCVSKGLDWMLVSIKHAPKLYELFYVPQDRMHEFQAEFERVYNDPDIPKEIVKARDIAILFTAEAYETGRHYHNDITRTNTHTPFKEPILSSNLCITGDQLVPSNHGLLTAKELYELGEDLILFDGEKQVKSSPMRLRARDQDVYKITLKNGMTHTVTDYHKVMTLNRGLVECKDLVVGDTVKINTKDTGLLDFSLLQTDIYSLLKEKGLSYVQVLYNSFGVILHNDGKSLYKPTDPQHYFQSDVVSVEYSGIEDVYCPTVESEDHLFVANGFITRNCNEICLVTRPFDNVMCLYEEFSSEYAYITYEDGTQEVVKDVNEAKALFNTWEEYNHVMVINDKPVSKIERKNEIALCNIGAVNLAYPNISDEDYYDACYYLLSTIDYVIDNSEFPFPNVAYTAKARRSAGVGINNYAYDLAKNGLYYTSSAAYKHTHFTAERHYYMLLKASIQLAKEAEEKTSWIDKTKWKDGWLPIDTGYTDTLKSLMNFELKYDWEALRAELKAGNLPRHSVLAALMPCESSSIVLNTTNSVYPIRQGILVKTDGGKQTVTIAPQWDELMYSYQSAFDIPTEVLAIHYGIFQVFTDQGGSFDYYYDSTKPESEINDKGLLKEYMHKRRLGIKSQYYTNSKTLINGDSGDRGCSSGACDV